MIDCCIVERFFFNFIFFIFFIYFFFFANEKAINVALVCGADGYDWVEEAAHGIDAPLCEALPQTRKDVAGMEAGYAASNDLRVLRVPFRFPKKAAEPCVGNANCRCVLRARLNVTTDDVPPTLTSLNNFDDGLLPSEYPSTRAYDAGAGGVQVSLALSLQTHALVYEDRSHTFKLLARPDESVVEEEGTIYNVNVRGRRGGIAKTLPFVSEYDFVPTALYGVQEGDAVHFQWTGANTLGGANDAFTSEGRKKKAKRKKKEMKEDRKVILS